jgi:polyhydroxyalkanoate synthesis regulator protein
VVNKCKELKEKADKLPEGELKDNLKKLIGVLEEQVKQETPVVTQASEAPKAEQPKEEAPKAPEQAILEDSSKVLKEIKTLESKVNELQDNFARVDNENNTLHATIDQLQMILSAYLMKNYMQP